MNTLPVLLRRELQENRGSFIYLPLILSAFLIVLMLTGLTFSGTHAGGSFSVQMEKQSREVQGEAQDQTHEVVVVQPLSGEAIYDRDTEIIHSNVRFADIWPSRLASAIPNLEDFKLIDVPLKGEIDMLLDRLVFLR